MSELKKYDLSGKEVGKSAIDESLLKERANPQLVKNYLVAMRNNARQWSANTKTRAEVARSKKKPHAQKGTGRARQGATSAPQYKGGGVVFGPKPKFDQHVRINRKEKRAAIHSLLVEKISQGQVKILKTPSLKQPRTKKVAEFLEAVQLTDKSVLFLSDEKNDAFAKSLRNIPRKEFALMPQLNGNNIAGNQVIVFLDKAFDHFKKTMSGKE